MVYDYRRRTAYLGWINVVGVDSRATTALSRELVSTSRYWMEGPLQFKCEVMVKAMHKGRIYLLIDPTVEVESDDGSVCLSAVQIGNSVRICGVFDDVGGHI